MKKYININSSDNKTQSFNPITAVFLSFTICWLVLAAVVNIIRSDASLSDVDFSDKRNYKRERNYWLIGFHVLMAILVILFMHILKLLL